MSAGSNERGPVMMADRSGEAPHGQRLCPSSRAERGAILLGIVGAEGKIGYLTPEMRIGAEFLEVADQGRTPEKRFRFAGPCVEAGCAQWTGTRCGVIDAALDEIGPCVSTNQAETSERSLPKCSIRARCRWFAQQGRNACAVCPLIITDVGGRDTQR